MIKKVKPLAFDSFGVRSMATYVETDDARVLIDPGVALAPIRYGLPPHNLELQRMDECWETIKHYAVEADALIVTHYHYDHHDPASQEIYENKNVFIKHPTENINKSQRGRAAFFLEAIEGLPKRLEIADGKTFQLGKTTLSFSEAVYHGTNPRLGYVVEVSLKHGNETLVFTSDVEGPSIPNQIQFILRENPSILIVDGPMTYMLGFRYAYKSLEISNQNLVRVLKETKLHDLIIDHHLLRDLKFKERISPVVDVAEECGVRVLTAAEYDGRKVEILEALRKELYAEKFRC
jgi:hypothetical protein